MGVDIERVSQLHRHFPTAKKLHHTNTMAISKKAYD